MYIVSKWFSDNFAIFGKVNQPFSIVYIFPTQLQVTEQAISEKKMMAVASVMMLAAKTAMAAENVPAKLATFQ